MEPLSLVYGYAIGHLRRDGRIKVPVDFRRVMMGNSNTAELILHLDVERRFIDVHDADHDCRLMRHEPGTSAQGDTRRDETSASQNARSWFGLSQKVEIGMDDRFTVPAFMRECAGLDDEVIMMATGTGFEMWNPASLLENDDTGPALRTLLQHLFAAGCLVRTASPPPGNPSDAEDTGQEEPCAEAGTAVHQAPGPPVLIWPACDQRIELVHHRILASSRHPCKVIRYQTPVLELLNSQWTIIVERHSNAKHGVIPLWRSVEENVGENPGYSIRTGWREMRDWPGFDPHDRKHLGLPAELYRHYEQHRATIEHHAAARRSFSFANFAIPRGEQIFRVASFGEA
ncbi:MAG: hypothetical protein JSR96_07305 [Proteobacteria bacterium]|nr:hypothetical protein [Pseudomonadota bacterium]